MGFVLGIGYPTDNLLANTGEPPVGVPVVAAVDVHPALAEPTAERGVAPVAFRIFPMSAVGLLIGEGGIGFIHGGDGDWVSGLEDTQLELLFEVVIGDETVALREIGFEEHDLDFIAFTFRHRIHDLAVGVLRAASDIQGFLRGASADDCDSADGNIRMPFGTGTKHFEHLLGESVAFVFQDHLNSVLGKCRCIDAAALRKALRRSANLSCGDSFCDGGNVCRHWRHPFFLAYCPPTNWWIVGLFTIYLL